MQPIQPTATLDQHTQNTSVAKVLSGNVSPGNGLTFDNTGQPLTYSTDNMSGTILVVVFAAANTNKTIQHNLNAVPYGYIPIAKHAATDIYWGSVNATDMEITLKSTIATTATIWILC